MPKPTTIKDHHREIRAFQKRALIAAGFVLIMVFGLLAQMAYLQIVQHKKYTTLSDKNRISIEPIGPTRGLIFDRNGTLLADNQPNYAVSIIKERSKDLNETINKIGATITLSKDDRAQFHKRLKHRRRPNTSTLLRHHLTKHEIAQLTVRQHEIPAMIIEAKLIRHYPHKDVFSHVIGYVSRINQQELARLDPNNYSGTHRIGKTGIEKYYESDLHGYAGFQTIESDARGKLTRILERTDPVPGKNLHLYLDLPTQKAAVKALDGFQGSIVAIDTNSGGIIAMVSRPGFDPNLFVTGIGVKPYTKLRDSQARPLFNRSVQGQYPPGSTIKPIIGLAGLEKGETSWQRKISDPGWYRIDDEDRYYRDWRRQGHGLVDLDSAIVQSCDTYFYDLSFRLGIDNIHDFMAPFGFGNKTGIDIAGEQTGLLPSRFWKSATKNQPWYPGETLITGIGQGYMLATPTQLALSTAIIANRGMLVQPKLVKSPSVIKNVMETEPPKPIQLKQPENWNKIIRSMRRVVHSLKGTASRVSKDLELYDIAGKTGTAQVLGIKQDEKYDENKIAARHRDHALFIGFAPVQNPQIAIAVIVENGGSGGSRAAPIAKTVMDAYFASSQQTKSQPSPGQEISHNR